PMAKARHTLETAAKRDRPDSMTTPFCRPTSRARNSHKALSALVRDPGLLRIVIVYDASGSVWPAQSNRQKKRARRLAFQYRADLTGGCLRSSDPARPPQRPAQDPWTRHSPPA